MLVALSMRTAHATAYKEKRDAVSWDWINFCQEWNITPILIPNSLDQLKNYFNQISITSLLLTGGDDLGPADQPSERDRVEFKLLDLAREKNIPILGVCRGLLIINRYFGGSIIANKKVAEANNHVNCNHLINWLPNNQNYEVNSFHNFRVAPSGLAPNLKPLALSKDQAVEALEHKQENIRAIMWHPERSHESQGLDVEIIGKWLCQQD
ncbi:gamma-glutamyl-gamma-aminobutyrate hydrolase family protein [Kiloniella majae]|uniref:gamma-glutamyl-gamma-aminobutyrate hydrolase family protein n=1 Tax=Kiloniella majae TaxID=1938558 RepID=UPI000A277D24|nr:gamma-glutamyl-gamma-aminobutyrate hydrolase family protein [Kiloniella majae]